MAHRKEQFPIEIDIKKRIISIGNYKISAPIFVSPDKDDYNFKFKVLEANIATPKLETLRNSFITINKKQDLYYRLKSKLEKIEHTEKKRTAKLEQKIKAKIKQNTDAWVQMRIALDREILDLLGPKFNRRIFVAMTDLWIKPEKNLIFKSGVLWFTRISGSFGERFAGSSAYVKNFWRQKKNLLQAVDDNNEHLLPLIVFFNKNPSQLKKYLGKSLWKSLARNSRSRNFLLVRIMHQLKNAKLNHESRLQALSFLNRLSSTRLSILLSENNELISSFERKRTHHRAWDILESLIYCEANRPSKIPLSSNYPLHLVRDTRLMATTQDEPFSLKWSWKRMSEAHEKYTRNNIDIHINSLSLCRFDWLSKYQESIIEANNAAKKEELGVSIHLVENNCDLFREGEEMKHCVFSYCHNIVEQNYMVLSIKSRNSRSTLGLVRDYHSKLWQVDQHYGPQNSPVRSNSVIKAANIAVKMILASDKKHS